MPELEIFKNLAIALALGLLIGIERGYKQRDFEEGTRVAGVRTFTLIGLMGGVMSALQQSLAGWMVALGFAALAALLVLTRSRALEDTEDYGATTDVAALLTYLFGALAVAEQPALATAGAVVTALLLKLKGKLHDALHRLQENELMAGLQLALISAVVLPLLPDEGYGPWQLLNPFKLWLMVVLICAISFVGHFAVRIVGAKYGTLVTGVLGGLASSTALTLTFSRTGRDQADLHRLLAAGVVAACTTMFPRVLLIVRFLDRDLFVALLLPIGVLTVLGAIAGFWLWRRGTRAQDEKPETPFIHPFQISTALKFAAALAVVLYATEAGKRVLGESGIYLVAFISGLTDVDAITLSLASMKELSTIVSARGVLIAALSNTVVKAGIVVAVAGWGMARSVVVALGIMAVAGIGLMFFL